MSRLAVLIVACVLTVLPAPCATAAELSKEEQKWAKEGLKRLDAESPAIRAGVQRALATLGTDAVPMLASAWWDAHEESDAQLVQAVLLKIGRKAVVKRLRRMQEEARGAEAKMLDALIGTLTDEESGGGASLPPPGVPDEKEEQRWAKECVKRFRANSPRVRTGAERAMASLGIGAVPILVDTWEKAKGRSQQAAVVRVLVEIGRDPVVEILRQFREGARGVEAKRLDALLEELGASSAPGTANAWPLSPSTTLDWDVVPFAAEHAVGEKMPAALGLGRHAVQREGPALAVDVDGDGKTETRLQPGEARTLRFGAGGRERPVLVYAKLGAWYACSASLLTGEGQHGKETVKVLLLDGDLDGSFVGEHDLLRIGDGGFHRFRKDGLVLWGEDRARYELVSESGGLALRLESLERPTGLDKGTRSGLLALNRFRARHGLPPLGHDAKRSSACRKHAAYLATNLKRSDQKSLGGTPHDETPGLPGYTKEGAEAGAGSNIGSGGDLARMVQRIGGTMLHRGPWLCDRSVDVGMGAAKRGGSWCVIWTGSGVADGASPVLVPPPGAHGVPRGGNKEWPPPDQVPNVYEGRVGYPVSVTYAPLDYEDVDLVLTMADGTTQVPGVAFTPARPITRRFPRNGGTAFYLPSSPLMLGSQYWAVFTAKQGGRPVRFAWTFTVD